MCSTRLEAIRWLSEYIQQEIPALLGNVCEVQGEPGHQLGNSSLAITPIQFEYLPSQASNLVATLPDRVVLDVGEYQGLLQLRITTGTLGLRYSLEEKILRLFIGTPLAPGILVGTITTCDEFGPFQVSFELNETEWNDARAADRQYSAIITVNSHSPALTIRTDAYAMQTVEVGTEVGNTNSPTETIVIDEDGSFEQTP